jgi:GT2 family glycosyltransferase
MGNDVMKVTAIVVTFNKKDYLLQVMEALKKQTFPLDNILVVDNASTDGTDEALSHESQVTYLRLKKNTGGAGGFYSGMKYAYEHLEPDFFWLMDDDCVPESEALAKLIRTAKQYPGTPFLNSLALWKDGTPCRMNIPPTVWEWTQHFVDRHDLAIPIQACSFVSCLVSRRAVELLGFPVGEFFIWYDDFEYTKRLSAMGHGLFVPDSRVTHLMQENMAVDWGQIKDSNAWKYLYSIRNEISWIFYQKASLQSFLRALWRLIEVQYFMKGLSKKLRLKAWVSGMKGFFFNYKKYIEKPSLKHHILEFGHFRFDADRYEGESWTALWGRPGMIHTHPPQPGILPLKLLCQYPPLGTFKAKLQLKDPKSLPVRFQVNCLDKKGEKLDEISQVLYPGSEGEISLRLPEDTASLELFSEMANEKDPCYCASAYWIDTRIEVHA